MYTQHFGLEKPVFDGGIAQHDDLFLGPQQQRVAANLKIGLTTRDSVVTLTGPLGVGKTTLAAQALRITTTRLAQTWVGNTRLAPDEMLELLLAGFELAPHEMGRVQRLHTWRQFMGEMSVTDTRICILVENAQALGLEGLQALEALTAADPNDCPGANLVLMGPAGLTALLEDPALASLKQRIRSRQRLEPMTVEEVEQYLRHRVGFAGGDYDKMFAPETAAMVHCFSAGIPRVINNVCETALTVAATRKANQLTPEIVQRVAEGVYGLAPSTDLPEASVATAPETAAAPAAAAEEPAAEPVPAAEQAPVAAAAPEPATAPSIATPASVDTPAPARAPAPAVAKEHPAEEPVQPEAPAPEAAPAAGASRPAEQPVPTAAPAAPAPAAAAEPVYPRDAETQEVPAASDLSALVEQLPEPPVLTAASMLDADDEPQPAAAADTSAAAQHRSEPPVLTDEVDFELPIDRREDARNAPIPTATLPADAPPLPESAMEADDDFSEEIASATHLHEISEEMAEVLFADYRAATSGSDAEKAASLDSSDLDLDTPPVRTAVMRQIDEDDVSEPEDDRQVAPTLVF